MIFLRVKHLSNRYWKDLQDKILLDHNDNKCACIHHVTFFFNHFYTFEISVTFTFKCEGTHWGHRGGEIAS